MHAYIHTYMHACMHTYNRTYNHTYIRTCTLLVCQLLILPSLKARCRRCLTTHAKNLTSHCVHSIYRPTKRRHRPHWVRSAEPVLDLTTFFRVRNEENVEPQFRRSTIIVNSTILHRVYNRFTIAVTESDRPICKNFVYICMYVYA